MGGSNVCECACHTIGPWFSSFLVKTHPLFFTKPQTHPHKSQSSNCCCRAGVGAGWGAQEGPGGPSRAGEPGLQDGRLLGALLPVACLAFTVGLGSCAVSYPHPPEAIPTGGRSNLRLLDPESKAGADRGESPREGRKCFQGGGLGNFGRPHGVEG